MQQLQPLFSHFIDIGNELPLIGTVVVVCRYLVSRDHIQQEVKSVILTDDLGNVIPLQSLSLLRFRVEGGLVRDLSYE